MEKSLTFIITTLLFISKFPQLLHSYLPCHTTCGSLQIKYPFGSGDGCGSPRIGPYITCNASQNQLILTTHTGSYPISSISYSTSTLTVRPNSMSTCTSMQQASSNLGLDWASPFQLGQSNFVLLACQASITSIIIKGSPMCDTSSPYLCASIYTCASITNLGLHLFAPTNTCCVYSPANFNTKGELDLRSLKCLAYTSVISIGNDPTDPAKWEYGVELKYRSGAFDDFYMDNKCNTCENSGGLCGYATSDKSFVCLCNNEINTTLDCGGYVIDPPWSSSSITLISRNIMVAIFGGLIFAIITA